MWSIFSRNAFASLPYEILDLVCESDRLIWKLHKGKRKQNGDEVSIFVCETTTPAVMELAKSALKRLKILRHPCILTFIDSLETEKAVYLVTEPVTPVLSWLSDLSVSSAVRSNIAAWGLLQVTKGLSFINNDGNLVHNNICEGSIFVTHGGEWKISGFEYASTDPNYIPLKAVSVLSEYKPPEQAQRKSGGNHWAADMWGLACLIWEVFNQQLERANSMENTSNIPQKLLPMYCELTSTQYSRRPNPSAILERLQKPGQFFSNDLTEVMSVLDELTIKDDDAKHRFFVSLAGKLDNIPAFISKNKILPALLSAHEFSNAGSVILTPLFKIGQLLEDCDYQTQIVPCVVKMFSSSNRATRLVLLQDMESFSEHLDKKTVNDQIFAPLVSGFHDTTPIIREHSVKAILHIAQKLNYNNLNIELMKHFAKLQSKDDQGGIRTNTTVCLGKMASYLHADTRKKCLVSAFTRAMRDPFPPARIAGVTAIAATQQFYPLSDVASRIVPALSQLTLDPEKTVRDAVFRVLKGFVGKLEKVSEDPELREVMEKEVASGSSASAHASMWAGWAVGALTSKFYKTSIAQKVETPVNSTDSSSNSTGESSVRSLSPPKLKKEQPNPDNKQMTNTTNSELGSNLIDFDNVGDGWDEEEEWGTLETAALNPEPLETQTSSKSSSAYQWDTSSDNDFFNSLETKQSSKLANIPTQKDTEPADPWDSWETGKLIDDAPSQNSGDQAKRQREAKKLQRQKEIEAKRANRTGPMKLGAKKI